MSRGLRSNLSCYDDAGIWIDNDRMFYAGDTFDRCDEVTAKLTSDNAYTSISADKALSGTVSTNACSFDSLCNAVNAVASNSVSVSSSFDELAARISALESAIDKEINGGKNSFSSAVAGIKRLARTGLKTLQYGAR
jgi:hypothetical protein